MSAGLAQGDKQHDAVAEYSPKPVARHVPGIPYALELEERKENTEKDRPEPIKPACAHGISEPHRKWHREQIREISKDQMIVDDTSRNQALADLIAHDRGQAGRGEDCASLAHGSLHPCSDSHYFLVYCSFYQFVRLVALVWESFPQPVERTADAQTATFKTCVLTIVVLTSQRPAALDAEVLEDRRPDYGN